MNKQINLEAEVRATLESANVSLDNSLIHQLAKLLAPAQQDIQFLDPNVLGKGGRASLLGKLFSLHDIAATVGEAALSLLFGHGLATTVVGGLIRKLCEYRHISVELNEVEFETMLAVKRGAKTVEAVVQQTSYPQSAVDNAVDRLRNSITFGPSKIPLLRCNARDELETEF